MIPMEVVVKMVVMGVFVVVLCVIYWKAPEIVGALSLGGNNP